ncbi:hypothetical protein PHYBLDRAFT_175051 [Phycomyces blakesleeanus NRRL 1555(-)]|uniref:F-box domain-containing protein n=1 Tax=Phycomyces blakesleeanus (strain ATCC 8743b / DSM 1359 / FGSC 10004 / NBRC 33097 / NRRL 1555) TaxID=763407 RepID=A0A162TEH8_PHYB8|nr:hypothetical protein PHYBLDRAFT_175051 [Phycomyces blakesleeanus NRRL 1555(-)]OAD66503.1 hypothetical protein PHYBLDRAFT_175051 [Phycomyces blakesleeanus NRRL 1555(-)]|eukprot:XP_018284543.1 hypothetical protein PHYBLDRAFT_175051 [Phycomyces blakesleeanus NRRL 1555(-)]
MLVTDLPFEIISLIIGYLSTKDRNQCSIVCQAWKLPSTEALWKQLNIRSKKQIRGLSSIQQSLPVQTLCLHPFLSINPQQLFWIQNHFPKLRSVCISPEALHPDCLDTTLADWTLWRSLTKLELCTDNLRVPKETILYTLSALSSLTSLSWIQSTDGTSSPPFGWKDLEALHTNLPRLVTLYLKARMDQLSAEQIQLISRSQSFSPARCLTCMTWEVNTLEPHWLIYWAYKYPNICSLQWLTIDHDTKFDSGTEIITLPETLPSSFQKLGNLTLEGVFYTHRPQHALFLLLHRSNVHLKSIQCSIYINQRGSQKIPSILNDIMQSSSSLQSLKLNIHGDVDDPNLLPSLFKTCPRLLVLSIRGMRMHLSLDRILDKCVSLESLYINVSRLHVEATAPAHSIQAIVLTAGFLNSSELTFLSKRCTELKTLGLVDLILRTDEATSHGQALSLDLSSLHLRTLCVKRVMFYKSNVGTDRPKLQRLALVLPQTSILNNDERPQRIPHCERMFFTDNTFCETTLKTRIIKTCFLPKPIAGCVTAKVRYDRKDMDL